MSTSHKESRYAKAAAQVAGKFMPGSVASGGKEEKKAGLLDSFRKKK
jgi:hypothetical protein